MRTVFWSSASVLHNYLPWPGERARQPRMHCVKTRYLAYERGLVKRNQFAKVLMRLQQIIIITERPAICHLNVTIIFSVAPPFRVSHLESAEKGALKGCRLQHFVCLGRAFGQAIASDCCHLALVGSATKPTSAQHRMV